MTTLFDEVYWLAPWMIVSIQFVFFVVGGGISTKTSHGPYQLGRIQYFFGISLFLFSYTLLNYLWLYGFPLVFPDFTAPVVVGTMFGHGVLGYFVGKIGAARSNDFSGNRRSMWMAFVPLLNLGLTFPRSKTTQISKSYVGWIMIVGAVLCFIAGGFVNVQTKKFMRELAIESHSELTATAIQRNGLERYIDNFVDALTFPHRALLHAEASKNKLILIYLSEGNTDELAPIFVTAKLRENCRNSTFKHIIDSGGEIVSIYKNSKEKEIGRIITNKENC